MVRTDGSLVSGVGQKFISFGRNMAFPSDPSGMPDQAGQKRGGRGAVAFEVVGIGAMEMYGGGGHDGDMSSVYWRYHGFWERR